jgi:DinB family protein
MRYALVTGCASFVLRRALLVASVVVAPAAARSAAAQDVPNREAALEVRKRFVMDLDTLQSKFLALGDAIPADKYAWRPAPRVRSVGEVFMHVASEYYVYAPMSYGGARSPVIPRGPDSFKTFEAKSTKADVQKHLKEGFAYAKQTIEGLDPAAITGTKKMFGGDHTIIETSFIMTDDLHEHLGQLIAYARMNGVVPPWSK